jgi:hypothetical protein
VYSLPPTRGRPAVVKNCALGAAFRFFIDRLP